MQQSKIIVIEAMASGSGPDQPSINCRQLIDVKLICLKQVEQLNRVHPNAGCSRVFSELQSHYLFKDRFGRPGKGNDKGKVEGLVGYARRNFMVPMPRYESFDALNRWLEEQCLKRQGDRLRGAKGSIEDRLARDLDKLSPLPPVAYDACETRSTQSTSLSLVRYRCVDYSVPTAYAHRDVLVRGYVHVVVISCGAEIIARHSRSYEREDIVFDPLH